MAPMGSTPSKPAALTAANFSATEPLRPMVSYMMALRMGRVGAGSFRTGTVSAARAGRGAAAAAAVARVVARKWRRVSWEGSGFIGLDEVGFAGGGDGWDGDG